MDMRHKGKHPISLPTEELDTQLQLLGGRYLCLRAQASEKDLIYRHALPRVVYSCKGEQAEAETFGSFWAKQFQHKFIPHLCCIRRVTFPQSQSYVLQLPCGSSDLQQPKRHLIHVDSLTQ